ncbi:VWA domain-containing protein [Arcobacter roscoffensis]|uniref:VWA domain-containing protein n=1 Tax=Arcobacter roscoffensis TaxID=2961520 RepID=A0ABY5E7X2_9BACT|nr:VWA domain-containing protein [Arcobacter roscoffensis]UTJ07158.1 VWA domain-containing protein [Arcobacter roscoffensis]
MFDITFEYPYLLLLILLFIFCAVFCKAKSPSYLIPHLHIFSKSNMKTSFITSVLKYLTIVFAILALASPIKINNSQVIKNDGINIVLNLDASGSMQELGFDESNYSRTRFDSVKQIVSSFIEKRVNDNIAFVLFGQSAMIASPLSFDKQAQSEILKYFEVGILGNKTAILDSLALSIKVLKDKQANSNIIILLSDGMDNASSIPLQVIERMLKKYNIKVYGISIGNSNNYILDKVSSLTGGKSYRAYNTQSLETIYKDIDLLEKSKIEQNRVIIKDYLFFYPLFISVLSLCILIFLRNKS